MLKDNGIDITTDALSLAGLAEDLEGFPDANQLSSILDTGAL